MRTTLLKPFAIAAFLLIGTSAAAIGQTSAQEHEAHHPADQQEAAASPSGALEGDASAESPGGMAGMMGMMTPEMAQMMQHMMLGRGAGPGASGMMMNPGMTMCPMMQAMAGMGPAVEGQEMGGPGLLYGVPPDAQEEMTPGRVRTLLQRRLAWHGNPRLQIGEIGTAADGSITAEIVTADGSVVQKLAFNRYPGLVRQILE